MSVLSTLGGADDSYMQYALLAVLAGAVLINLKTFPGVWHLRVLKGLFTQFLGARLSPRQIDTNGVLVDDQSGGIPLLFSYLVTSHQNALMECDYNMHKSNSTFFSDLDINRAQLLLSLFPRLPRWAPTPESATEDSGTDAQKSKKREKTVSIALGGTSCVFKREIKPLQRYEVWSRVLSWDEKWLVLVSYFVKAGTHKSVMRALQKGDQNKEGSEAQKAILAVAVTRYVFKDGRRTAPPEEVLQCVGLYPSAPAETDKQDIYASLRKPGSDVLGFFGSLDSLPSHFGDASSSILGHYSDL
ncbi:hypothetical protein N7471_012437 [Penicillium samsonianum]|uniref:uncharacterized protein n=1 Tax=Penicillium samsonianum TaxID=1882272 RepID=UPI0025481CCF|nr:uncharacterized protein N7471_012437 [Penicillium samsonianum]KAJ6125120.1 hypothetical protein N7471_012437 [Penicillium samsonianum]